MNAVVLLLAAALASAAEKPADLILSGGRVYLAPGRFAEAVAVTGNRITAVGKDADILALKGPKTQLGALKGRLVLPGFHDAHASLFSGAESLAYADLRGALTPEEILTRAAAHAALLPEEEWALARGWELSAFPEGSWPSARDLDPVVSTRPAALWSADGRMLWLNSEGLRRAGIWSKTDEVTGGRVVRAAGNIPTGLLIGNAVELGRRAFPKRGKAERLRLLKAAATLARENGVTALHAMPAPGDPPLSESYADWKVLHSSRAFALRLFVYGRLEDPAEAEALRRLAAPMPRVRYSVPGLLQTLDGAHHDRTAALLEPYFDEPKGSGALRLPAGRLRSLVRAAHELQFQVALRAAGDRAIRQALDACEESVRSARKEGRVLPLRPCRVDGAEAPDPADWPRFKALGAAVAAQPAALLFPDAMSNYYPNRLGGRSKSVLPLKSLLSAGAPLALSTGWPERAWSPLKALSAAVLRRFQDGAPPQGWLPPQKLSVEEAISALTEEPARLAGLPDQLGTIAPGRLADLVVLDRDLFAASPEEISEARVDLTVFDGKVVYRRD